MTEAENAATAAAPQQIAAARRMVSLRSWSIFGALIAVALYFVYAWMAFGVSAILDKAQPERALTFAKDSVAYKVHVTRDMRSDGIEVSIENERTATYKSPPSWVEKTDGGARVDLGDGVVAEIDGAEVRFTSPEHGDFRVISSRREIVAELPQSVIAESEEYERGLIEARIADDEQDRGAGLSAEDRAKIEAFYQDRIETGWLSAARKRFDILIDWDKRITVTGSKIEIHRYFYGWENFFFAFESPLQTMSAAQLWRAAWSDERIDPKQSNASLIFSSFWNNPEWRHGYVFTAVFETILMAFLGTAFAAIFGLPLAFLAAKNFTPSLALRFGLRRVFDFLRGIDMLIWSLIFIRAFGLGPLTGAMAIAFTDTGTLGKLFSEALENVDNKQIEGVRATGASQVQRYRFGVIPQILPVFTSQSLYFLESNTRSATVIGALGAGGIGLVLVETMNTQSDWENVLWLIILTILLVTTMDLLSSWLRRRLIDGSPRRRA